MGIESRDYLRHESEGNYRSFNMSSGGWAVKYLIIANVVVFLLEVAMGAIGGQLTNIDPTGATSMMWHAYP